MRKKAVDILVAWIPSLTWASFIFYLSSRTWGSEPAQFQINDKVVHVGLYGVLGTTLAWAGRAFGDPKHRAELLLLGLLFAASDEWHQSFVAGRTSSWADLAADALGLILGYLILVGFYRFRNRGNAGG